MSKFATNYGMGFLESPGKADGKLGGAHYERDTNVGFIRSDLIAPVLESKDLMVSILADVPAPVPESKD